MLAGWPPSRDVLPRLRPAVGQAEGELGVWSAISSRFKALYGIPLTQDLLGAMRR